MERQTIVDAALSVVGLGANPAQPENKLAYTELIAPSEPEYKIRDMLKMSGCGLTVAGIWRKAGVKHYKLNPPYIVGTGISRLVTLAHKVGAWIPYSKDVTPSLGDMVLVGDNGEGGVEHVYTVVFVSDDGREFESVDGGQKDPKGFQTILHKNRIWKDRRDIAFIGNDPGNNAMGRKIMGWVDCTKLPTE